MNVGNFKHFLSFQFLLLCFVLAQQALGADLPAGQVVWWGKNYFWKKTLSINTNGLVENGNEFLDDAVAVTAIAGVGLALKSDSTVFAFGLGWPGTADVPVGLSNVVSITSAGGSFWAIKRDGTVANWGSWEKNNQNQANIVASLSNVTTIAWSGYKSYLALKNDSTLLGFRLDDNETPDGPPPIQTVEVQGQVLSNVVALASMDYTPLVLKRDGTVFSLGYQTPGDTNTSHPLFQYTVVNSNTLVGHVRGGIMQLYTSLDPVMVGGEALSNVVAIASGRGYCLALKNDGTVVSWGDKPEVPAGLSNVVAITPNLALKRDGTVVAWSGDNHYGENSVPAGLSNVVAIATGGDFNLAVITGSPPASVFVQSEEMEREADLIFKGQALSSERITNSAFGLSFIEVNATKFKIISVLKGNIATNEIEFQHYGKWKGVGGSWGGPPPPASYKFETGQSYLVFAASMDKPDKYYSVLPGTTNAPGKFRQLASNPHRPGEGVLRTLDARPLPNVSVKQAHWIELNLLLNDANPTNVLDAIDQLDHMSPMGTDDDEWSRSHDFRRKEVLTALLPLITSTNEQIASRALNCFVTESNASAVLEPFAASLVEIANKGATSRKRLNAIAALSSLQNNAVSNSVAQLLKDPDENIRVEAVRLLPRFPAAFAEQGLRERADDDSANVRSVVADVIGDEKYEGGLPVLVKLFSDPVGRDKLIPPTTISYLQAGQRWSNIGDVHTAAGYALVKFAPTQVSDILKSNLNDPGFHISFIAKLAQGEPEPWLPELVSILEARRAYVDDVLKSPWNDPRRFADPQADRTLIGNYTKCWEDIRQYLLKKSPEELASGEYDSYMDLLGKMIQPDQGMTIYPAKWLYELYWTKHLSGRVASLRQKYDAQNGWWFDDFNQRGEAAGVDAIVF